MKRTLIVLAVMLVAACGSSSWPPADPGSSTTGGQPAPGAVAVSGRVVRADTGHPYPNAWIRFEVALSAVESAETHTVTDAAGRYVIRLAAGQYQVSAGDDCDLNAQFDMVGRVRDDIMISVPQTTHIDFIESAITPGYVDHGICTSN
jgi:hypothetical protein